MKNTRKHILLSFAVLMMTMTACGQVNDDKTESRKSSASSNVDSSSSESDSSLSPLSDSSKSDSKTTTTTAATKATSSITTTSIVTVTDAKGNLLSKISIDENGKVINLDKDGKPKTTTKKSTNKTGSTSSGGTATTTRKTTSGGGNSTSYTSNSGNSNSGGYSNGNSGSYDNSYSNNNNSGNSGNSGSNNSSSNNNQQQQTQKQTEQQTQAPEPEPEPVVWDGYTLDWWLQSDFRSKDDYINIGRGLINDGSDLSKAKAVYKYMLTTYKSEHPDVNCISYASATYALCKGIGLDCRYIMYSDWYNHVSTAVYVDDGWYNMDTNCASNSGWSENEIRLFENNKNGMDYTQICDEYENYGNISCLSKSNYFEYCEKINGYTCIYPLSEDEAVEYHRTGKLPQHVLDDIEFDKQTL